MEGDSGHSVGGGVIDVPAVEIRCSSGDTVLVHDPSKCEYCPVCGKKIE